MNNQYLVLPLFLFFLFLTACKSTNGSHSGEAQDHAYTNALIGESSPYLLQHAHNPVNWYPWKEEALAKAKAEQKLMIISVGYASCHWCHVMEKESFEDTTVSRLMNEHFVSIKVDREERPDIDDVYMTACQMASDRGCGWPLNAFALPDGRPVWAGTYFPKKQWMEVMEYFLKVWQEEPEKLQEYADQLTKGIQQNEEINFNTEPALLNAENLENTANAFLKEIDFKLGGRKGSPKFPMPNNYEFLQRYAFHSNNDVAQQAVETTLDALALGGIYDHLGGGWARYSTDAEWKVPHFEKMLYDNGQLVSLFSQAYQQTGKTRYAEVVKETLDFIGREMTTPDGGFYSSFDADSEGEEGKFYVWTQSEIESVLGNTPEFELVKAYYQIQEKGNWEEEKNILHASKPIASIAKNLNMNPADATKILQKANEKLFAARKKRVHPSLDDKVLTSWNALMLKGYVDAYKAFGEESYRETAIKNGRFLKTQMLQPDARLNRNFKDGKSTINAFLDDYANLIQAYIGLYEITFDQQWLDAAKALCEYTLTHFFDESSGMFFYTSDLDPELIARKKVIADNVIPASNSTMARNLHALGLYYYNNDWIGIAKQMIYNMETNIVDSAQPSYYSNWCILYQDLVKPPYEIAIVGPNWESKRKEMQQHYIPNAIFMGGAEEGNLQLLENKLIEGETRIYVCQDKICKLPVTEVDRALELMKP